MTKANGATISVEHLEDGAYWDVELGDGKGNVLDSSRIVALNRLFHEAGEGAPLKAVCLRGRGSNFSFGASVAEHLPGAVDSMLPLFHSLFHSMSDSAVVCLAAVRGRCLGGGLELASFCQRVFASPDAKLGQPEIVLGVFAPIASLLLSERIGRANAEDLCLSGRVIGADEALRIGLVDEISDNPEEAALAYFRAHLSAKSARSLRLAVRALRQPLASRLERDLGVVERLYLEELMTTNDATEGLRAFLEKREPVWRNA